MNTNFHIFTILLYIYYSCIICYNLSEYTKINKIDFIYSKNRVRGYGVHGPLCFSFISLFSSFLFIPVSYFFIFQFLVSLEIIGPYTCRPDIIYWSEQDTDWNEYHFCIWGAHAWTFGKPGFEMVHLSFTITVKR